MNFIPITNLFIAIIRESSKNFHAKDAMLNDFSFFFWNFSISYTEIVNFSWNAFTNFDKAKVFLEWYYLLIRNVCIYAARALKKCLVYTKTDTHIKNTTLPLGKYSKFFTHVHLWIRRIYICAYASAGSHDKIRHL